MPLEVVAITGASGFLAQHLIAYLQNNATDVVKEIRAVDRKPFKKFLATPNLIYQQVEARRSSVLLYTQASLIRCQPMQATTAYFPSVIPIKHYEFDICNELHLEHALSSCTTVFHCAAKSFEFVHSEQNFADQYWHDNVNATESLINVMQTKLVRRLIFVGDAFSMLPAGDNYGLSEYMHQSLPSNFMLGSYGESKARSELIIKNAAQKGSKFDAIILRPPFIFGEGETHLISMAKKVCSKYGGIPIIDGDDRGNHQFIYAGNMAAIMERSMRCLMKDAAKYNGEVVLCLDRTTCMTFTNFIMPYMEASGFRRCDSISYLSSFLMAAYHSLLSKIGSKQCFGYLTLTAHRFLNGWTVGFSNRKLRLLLDFIPPFDQSEAMKKSIEWYEENETTKRKQPSVVAGERPKTG
ncbi:3 beta-hydroxysteroid dehydrogenase/Delta 5--_4-isomerase [Toxocara canis]|uniref:3 beta-hydroxysteroid dehydrogenase/Delta 5-->4-isomerase n=1 Tax=Toxocara canis TaxID=6265 RepID=A0A0B2VQY8_TOXCA|nr:3 beta-hydroxysteroid dehydrogenase/Delta 5-->4-isomerase [Toxocara canis]